MHTGVSGFQAHLRRALAGLLCAVGAIVLTIPRGDAAVTNVWVATGLVGVWSNSSNWALGHVPSATEVATFSNVSSTPANVDVSANVAGVNISSLYTGTVTLGASMTVGSSGFSQTGGTFNGSSFALTTGALFLGPLSAFSGSAPLTVTGPATIDVSTVNTTGGQSYHGTVTPSGAITFMAGGPIQLSGALNAPSLVTLNAGTFISESGGGLVNTTFSLTASATTGITLGGANTVGTFNATNTTAGNVTLTNTAAPLTITGISESGGGSVTINNTGAVSVTGTISTGSGAVNLTASGALSESGGTVSTSSILTTGSVGGTSLTGANTVGAFNATNTTSGNVSLANSAIPLTVTGIAESGGGSVSLNNTGPLSVTGTISAGSSGAVNLTATGTVAESGSGAVSTAGTLTTSSAGGTTLNNANGVGGFNATNTTSGNLELTNSASPLTVTGISESGGGFVNVINTGGITVSGSVTAAAGGAVGFTSTSTLSEVGGGLVSTTGTLFATAATGVLLTGNNAVGSFQATNTTSGQVTLDNAGSLTVNGINQSGGGGVLVINTGALTVGGLIVVGSGGSVTLSTTQSLVEGVSGGVMTSGTLNASSVGGQTLNGANGVGAYTADNSTSGNITMDDSGSLTLQGITQSGGGSVTVTDGGTTTVQNPITVSGGTGGVFINSDGGPLVILASITTANGSVSVGSVGGGISLGASVNAGTGIVAFGSDVSVTSNVTVTASMLISSSVALGNHLLTVTGTGAVSGLPTLAVSASGKTAPGVDFGQLDVATGNVSLTGTTLSLNVAYAPAFGDTLTIVNVPTGTVIGTFTGLADGSIFLANGRLWQIHYTAHTVTVTEVSANRLGTAQSGAAAPPARGSTNQAPPASPTPRP